MTLLVAIVLVLASSVLGAAAALWLGWRVFTRLLRDLGREERRTFELWAVIHRWFSQVSGYDAIALTTDDGQRLVVALEAVAEAIHARDLLTHEPVRVTPPSEPPPPDTERGTCDGHA